MSGEQEPWVFRGGLTADLQRLIPVDSGNDLFIYKPPDVPCSKIYTIRPYLPTDEAAVYEVCRKTCDDGMDGTEVYPGVPNLIGDRSVGSFLTLSPEFCFVVEDCDWGVVGYALAALDARQFASKVTAAWVPEMCEKYPKPEPKESDMMSVAEETILGFHNYKSDVPDSILTHHPSCLTSALLTSVMDQSVAKRLITCLLAALRANGSFGCHIELNVSDKYLQEFYTKLGFTELGLGLTQDTVFLGRTF
ncbi:hypothetical protein B566_EDAN008112 [Ephemera danica]|nr:hypothetical protein B566_EDAN008112 [Ephemera danica]